MSNSRILRRDRDRKPLTGQPGVEVNVDVLFSHPVLVNRGKNPGKELNLIESLRLWGHDKQASDLEGTLRAKQAQKAMMSCPIIAVLGELNAGKSSVVASFLSSKGRDRIPRGIEAKFGTHRFVYWVPTSWLQSETNKQAFFDLLAAAHGNQREFLSTDPQEAAEQYRSGRNHVEIMKVPLIAEDPELDPNGAAFLDCPDVQTGDTSGRNARNDNQRLEFVGDAAKLCSAFLLVWERAKVRDSLFTSFLDRIRDRMATVPLYLLINKIDPSPNPKAAVGADNAPAGTRNDADLVRNMERFHIRPDDCYGALHFKMNGDKAKGEPGWRDLTPPALVKCFDQGEEFPQFFALATTDAANEPAVVDETRFLENLPRGLDIAELQRQKLADNDRELAKMAKECHALVRTSAEECKRRAGEVNAGLFELCTNQFRDAKTGEPLQIPDETFTQALSSSFLRTAPFYLQPGLWLKGWTEQAKERARQVNTRLQKLLALLKQLTGSEVQEALSEQGIQLAQIAYPETLARTMHSLRWCPSDIGEDRLEDAWSRVLRNFRSCVLDLNDEGLDEMTADFWKGLTWWQTVVIGIRGVLGALCTVLALGGVVVAVIDGGATMLASFSLAATLAEAIPGGLAIGVAVMGTGVAFAAFMEGLVYRNTLPALANLFNLACDAFGVPRRIDSEKPFVRFGKSRGKRLPLPDTTTPEHPAVCPLGKFDLWEVIS